MKYCFLVKNKKMKIIFILGSGHCGSTLLDIVLSLNNEIFGLGEIGNINKNSVCSCGESLDGCSIWSKINFGNYDFLKIYRFKKDFVFNKNNFISLKNKKIIKNREEIIRQNEKIYENILKISQSSIIIDSSKDIHRFEFLMQSDKIEPSILHIVRDGRAVAWSYYKKYKKCFRYILKWGLENLKIEILKRRYKAPFIFVSYNEFTNNPELVLKNILKKLNLNNYNLDLKNIKVGHQISGNRMRFNKNIEIKEDEDWKINMPLRIEIIFNIFFGWLNYYYNKKCIKKD